VFPQAAEGFDENAEIKGVEVSLAEIVEKSKQRPVHVS